MLDSYQALLVLFLGTGISIALVGFIIYSVLLYQKAKVAHNHELEQLKSNHEKAVLSTTLEIREESIQSVAREVHDNIGQVLSLASMHMSNLKSKFPDNPSINNVSELIAKGIADLRQILKILDGSSFAKYKLSELIVSQIELINRLDSANAHFSTTGTEWSLENSAKTILFRVIQESLTNAVKYANSTEINVKLDYMPNGLMVEINDNGIGITQEIMLDSHGLQNMKYRSSLLGASFNMVSSTNGTIIVINYPLGTDDENKTSLS
jgi:signal transduction histidine kinase